jgi:hypothetical protein
VRAAAGEEATVAGRGLAAGDSASRAAVPRTRCALAAGGGVASNTSSSSDSLHKGNVNLVGIETFEKVPKILNHSFAKNFVANI